MPENAPICMPALATGGHMTMPMILTATAAGIGLFLLYLLLNVFAALPPAGWLSFSCSMDRLIGGLPPMKSLCGSTWDDSIVMLSDR